MLQERKTEWCVQTKSRTSGSISAGLKSLHGIHEKPTVCWISQFFSLDICMLQWTCLPDVCWLMKPLLTSCCYLLSNTTELTQSNFWAQPRKLCMSIPDMFAQCGIGYLSAPIPTDMAGMLMQRFRGWAQKLLTGAERMITGLINDSSARLCSDLKMG